MSWQPNIYSISFLTFSLATQLLSSSNFSLIQIMGTFTLVSLSKSVCGSVRRGESVLEDDVCPFAHISDSPWIFSHSCALLHKIV